MSTTVTYKGNTLATVSNNTKTLKTAGKYMEGDVTLTDTSSTIVVSETLDANGGIIKTITTTDEVNLQTKTITPTSSVQTVNPDSGYDGFSQVIVNAGGGGIQIATATATMVQVGEDVAHWDVAYMDNGVLKAGIDIPYDNQYGTDVEVVLVGGSSVSELNAYDILDIEGDATYSNGILTITGDCTVVYEGIDDTPILIPKSVTSNGTYTAINDNADGYSSVTVNVPTGSTINNQNKTVTPSESIQSITADSGYTGLGTVTVNAISSTYVGSGITRRDSTDLTVSGATITIPAGYYANEISTDINTGYLDDSSIIYNSIGRWEGYITITSKVKTGGYLATNSTHNNLIELSTVLPTQSSKTIIPTESAQTAVTRYKWTTGVVTVAAIPSTYVGSGITQRDGDDLTVSGATVTAPAGYYAEAALKSVSSGSATGPTSLSGSSATITTGTNTITLTKTGVTTTPTVSAGYVSSATASTATVALTASVTVNPTPTASGATVTIPAGYYSAQTTKSVTSGSATAPSLISGTAASVSTGTNTLTLTKTVSVTPTVSAGYVSAGTAGNSSVSLTASVTTKAAATITPTTTNQTIASGTYLTGTQTIAGDADLVGSNILSTANIFGVQGTVDFIDVYIRSTAPTSSVGSDGDIYIQE